MFLFKCKVCFLEFFESLIGCAIKSYENSRNLTTEKNETRIFSIKVNSTMEANNAVVKSVSSINATSNPSPTKIIDNGY